MIVRTARTALVFLLFAIVGGSTPAFASTRDSTPPSAPGNLSATPASQQVSLKWSASTDNVGVRGYRVYRNGSSIATVGNATLSYTSTGLTNGTTYSYDVVAYDKAGNVSAASNTVSATPVGTQATNTDTQPPSTPSGVSAVAGDSQVSVSWTASSDNVGVSGYNVYRNGTKVGTTTSPSFTDSGLTNGTTYSYAVAAYDAAGNVSPQSLPVSATPVGSGTGGGSDTSPPSVPSGLAASPGDQQVNLYWAPSSDNVGVAGYRVYRNGTLIGSPTHSAFVDTGLSNGSSYAYTISAYDAAGNISPLSIQVSATPQAGLLSVGATLPYDPGSAWDAPIGSSPTVDPNSSTFINAIADNGLPLTSDPDQYTIPVYGVSSQTPTFTVTGTGYFHSYMSGSDTSSVGHGSPWTISGVPVPAGAAGGVGTDGQIILWNPTTGLEYEFWQFYQASDGTYHATNGNESYTTAGYYGRFGDGLAGRGDGTPYLAGLVRPWEIAQGQINHAIAFAYNSPSSAFGYPAAKSDGGSFGGVLGTDLPEGSRIQLNPNLTDSDFAAMGLSPAATIIAHALQRYGMIVVDHSGSSKIYLEQRTTAGWDSSITRSMLSSIPWSDFRVVDTAAGPA
jgi:chitodextrinase